MSGGHRHRGGHRLSGDRGRRGGLWLSSGRGRRGRHRLRVVATLLAFGLVAAACGGDDDEGAPADGAAATTTAAPAAGGGNGGETFEDIIAEEPGDTDDGDGEPDSAGGSGGNADDSDAGTGSEPAGDDPGDPGDPGEATDPEPEPEVDICDTATPGDVEIGVTAEEIVVVVAADVDTPLAPGLFQASFDGVVAWAEHVNSNGGLACRQVRVETFDTLLNPSESVNAQLHACENALAMVGTTALFVFDVTPLNTCADAAGNEIGLPDISQITTEIAHQCSANTFAVIAPQGACPYEGGERRYGERLGHIHWFQENINPDLEGVFMIPGDLPSTRITGVTTVRAAVEALGVVSHGEYGVSGAALQPVYGELVQAIRDNGANYARIGSNLQALVKFRSEAVAQGVDVEIWECTISCYDTAIFETGGGVEDGTYMSIFQLPFEEADTNAELQAFVDGMDGKPSAFAANAWASGVLFSDAVNMIIEETGDINAITRQRVLDALNSIDSFDANGMIGETNPVDGVGNSCYMLLQIQGQEFVRIHPEERGTLDCDPRNLVEVTMDAAAYVDEHLK